MPNDVADMAGCVINIKHLKNNTSRGAMKESILVLRAPLFAYWCIKVVPEVYGKFQILKHNKNSMLPSRAMQDGHGFCTMLYTIPNYVGRYHSHMVIIWNHKRPNCHVVANSKKYMIIQSRKRGLEWHKDTASRLERWHNRQWFVSTSNLSKKIKLSSIKSTRKLCTKFKF